MANNYKIGGDRWEVAGVVLAGITAANPPQEFKLINIREVWPAEQGTSHHRHELLIGTTLRWNNDPRSRANYIGWEPEGTCGYRTLVHEREAGYRVLADAMYRFHETLMPHVERLN